MLIFQVNLGRGHLVTKQLNNYIQLNNPDLVSICEPHPGNHTVTNLFPNYNLVHQNPSLLSPPIKAATLIRKGIDFIFDRELSTENFVVTLVNNNQVIITGYFEPSVITRESKRVEKNITNDLQILQKIIDRYNGHPIIILCDSNAKHPSWGNNKASTRGEAMHEFIMSNELIWLNDSDQGPTFTKAVVEQNSTQSSIRQSFIDLSIINNKLNSAKFDWKLVDDILSTEHKLIRITTKMKITPIESTKIDYEKTNWTDYFREFNRIKPKKMSVDGYRRVINLHEAALKRAGDLLVTRTVKLSNYWPPFCEELDEINRSIGRIRRKLSTIKMPSRKFHILSGNLKDLNRRFKQTERALIREQLNRVHAATCPDELWKIWKKTKTSPQDPTPLFASNRTRTMDENYEIIASEFIKSTVNTYTAKKPPRNLRLSPTSEDELRKIISNQSNRKAAGPDGLTNKLMKLHFQNDPAYFVKLFNLLLEKCEIPDQWKEGKLVYFSKKNRKITKPTDLRPITLINIQCKIAEILLANRIESHLNELNFFSEKQFGFKKHSSTVDAVKQTVRNIKIAQKFKYAILIALDASAAFDSISWHTIIDNITAAGADGSVVRACESILINRRVQLNGRSCQTARGTPQGGCASPLLWRIGSNSILTKLEKVKQAKTTAFADDMTIVLYSNDKRELKNKVNQVIDMVDEWCRRAEITLNREKTEIMSTGKTRITEIKVGQTTLKTVDRLKHLGMILDCKLLWNDHLDFLKAKTDRLATNLRRTFWFNNQLPLKQKLHLYSAVFVPTMSYGYQIWLPEIQSHTTKMAKLDRLQNSIMRLMTCAYLRSSSAKLMEILNILPLTQEIQIMYETLQLPPPERRASRIEAKREALDHRTTFFNLENSMLERLQTKEAIWCLTGAGPFKAFLHKCGLADDSACRFCGLADETSEHLLYACEILNLNFSSQSNTLDLTSKILIKELIRRPI